MILIIFVALLLFGGEKLPEIARGLGKGIRDFKDASEGVKREITNQINNYEEKKPEAPVQPVVDSQLELPAATEDHHIATESEAAVQQHDIPNPVTGIPGVPNTMPYNENHGTVSESQVTEVHHAETANTEAKSEPIKTTHE